METRRSYGLRKCRANLRLMLPCGQAKRVGGKNGLLRTALKSTNSLRPGVEKEPRLKRLRLSVVLDSVTVPAWTAEVVRRLLRNPLVTITSLAPAAAHQARQSFSLSYRLYRRW